jgi:hypothetical protein
MIWIWPPIRSVTAGAALTGHVLDVDAGRGAEHLSGEMAGRAETGRPIVQLAGVLLGERDKIGEAFHRLRGMHHYRDRHERDQREWREILDRVIGQPGIERGVDRMGTDGADQQRLAVGRRFRHDVGADRPAGAAAVVDQNGRLQRLTQHLRKRPRHDFGWPASRERHHDADLLARERPRLRRQHARQHVGTGQRRGQTQ